RSLAVGAAAATILAACSGGIGGGGGGDDDGSGGVVTIGYVSPQTGALSAFGEADTFVLDQMEEYYAENGITVGGEQLDVEIVVRDTQSDADRAADVTAELILEEEADVILVSSTPETVNPASDQCEANGVVCISTVAPWQAYYFGRGATEDQPFEWTYHFFWGTEQLQEVYQDIWTQAAPDATTVAELFPNDSDGNAWADPDTGFAPFIEAGGYEEIAPGTYPNGTTDFSAQISQYRDADAEILVGVPIPPDFTTFWNQAIQQGYRPTVATIAKAVLFPSAVEALGDNAENISTEVWWSPSHPFSSSLTGQSAAELADAYEESTGSQWTQPLGFVHALFEVATAALEAADSLDDPANLRDALAELSVDTIAGPVDWTSGPVPNVALTPLVGGQWRSNDSGGYDLVIVSNSIAPDIPTAGEPEPIEWDES
ncbi:MAG: ABC transporter substrate-binding protein, partial [Actinomycetaceae bacterium]